MKTDPSQVSLAQDLKTVGKNLKVTMIVFLGLGIFHFLGFISAYGLINLIFGHEVLSSKSKEVPIGAILILASSELIYLFAFFALWFIPVIQKFNAYRIIRLDGFEKYEIAFCRWYAGVLNKFADGMKNKSES